MTVTELPLSRMSVTLNAPTMFPPRAITDSASDSMYFGGFRKRWFLMATPAATLSDRVGLIARSSSPVSRSNSTL